LGSLLNYWTGLLELSDRFQIELN